MRVFRSAVCTVLAIAATVIIPGHLFAAGQQSAAAPEGAVEIDFYYPVQVGGSVADVMDRYATQFMEMHPDIRINVTYSGNYRQNETTIQTEIEGGGTGPHVSILAEAILYAWPREYFVPAQRFIDRMDNPQEFIDQFFPAFMVPDLSQGSDGSYWSVPFQRSNVILYYNKDLFRQAGLDPERPPRNRTELMEYARRLTGNGVYGFATPTAGWIIEALAIGSGEPVFDGDPAYVNYASDTMIEIGEFLQQMVLVDRTAAPGVLGWGDVSQDFISGKVAMAFHSTGAMSNHLQNSAFDVGVAFVPGGKGGADGQGYGTVTGGANLYVFDRGSEREQNAAWKWVEFLSSPEIQADWGIETGYIAANRLAWETDRLTSWVERYPVYGTARDQLAYAGINQAPYQYIDVNFGAFNNAIEAIMTGEMPAAEALRRAQSISDSILVQYR